MHALLNAMSIDMNIPQYQNESDESFAYRLCYSALGQWCLSTALNSTGGISGTTKHNQTIILTELFERYCSLFPSITKKFINVNNQQLNFTVNIRRVYEETGYLLTDSKNHNHIANYGRSIRIGNNYLFFGFPDKILSVNGLGVFTGSTNYLVVMKDFLIRDYLSSEDYFNAQFDPIDFYEKDIDVSEIEFFNPLSNTVPSMSWTKSQKVNCTVARKTDLGPFYRVMELS
jgi:hypothetical protein